VASPPRRHTRDRWPVSRAELRNRLSKVLIEIVRHRSHPPRSAETASAWRCAPSSASTVSMRTRTYARALLEHGAQTGQVAAACHCLRLQPRHDAEDECCEAKDQQESTSSHTMRLPHSTASAGRTCSSARRDSRQVPERQLRARAAHRPVRPRRARRHLRHPGQGVLRFGFSI
jgi:hypothetical protein